MALFEQKLAKVFGEIRYRPTLGSATNTLNLGKEIEPEFPHWRIQNQQVNLFDEKKKLSIQVAPNRLLFTNEGDESSEQLITLVDKVYTKLLQENSISDFFHVGCRRQYVFQSNFQIQDLVDLTFRKLYGNLQTLKTLAGEKILDTAFALDTLKDGFGVHVRIGPAMNDQAIKFFDAQFDNPDLQESKAKLLVDIDVYKTQKDGLKSENIIETLSTAEKISEQILTNFIGFLSEK